MAGIMNDATVQSLRVLSAQFGELSEHIPVLLHLIEHNGSLDEEALEALDAQFLELLGFLQIFVNTRMEKTNV